MCTLTRSLELIQFGCAKRSFCIDVDQVLGVISLPPHLTEAPPFMPFQGETIQVFCLESILEMEEKVRYTPPEVIVLKGDSGHFGISVDWVGEIHRVPFQRAVFRFPHASAARVKMFGVWGMAVLGKNLALILEPTSLLSKILKEEPCTLPNQTVPQERTPAVISPF
jgi:chemotaxis signal transduction protein